MTSTDRGRGIYFLLIILKYMIKTSVNSVVLLEKRRIADYLEERHLSDGGYFFARVEPSSGLDTYLAVKTLNLLGAKIRRVNSIVSFWKNEKPNDLFGIFLAVGTLRELGQPAKAFNKYSHRLSSHLKNEDTLARLFSFSISANPRLKNFSHAMDYISASGKDLQDLFYLTVLSRDLKVKIDREKIIAFVLSLQNKNGGFGHRNKSHLMTTYYALSILNALSYSAYDKERVYGYLSRQLRNFDYLEYLFFTVESLALLGRPLTEVDDIIQFIASCQRVNGGFSRDRAMGIPTIEDTYYAVKLLKTCENYSHKIFLK